MGKCVSLFGAVLRTGCIPRGRGQAHGRLQRGRANGRQVLHVLARTHGPRVQPPPMSLRATKNTGKLQKPIQPAARRPPYSSRTLPPRPTSTQPSGMNPSGTTGQAALTADAKDLGAISTKDYRCFDAVYEQLSGKLMVVAATASNTISYWTWDAGTWSSASTYTLPPRHGHHQLDQARSQAGRKRDHAHRGGHQRRGECPCLERERMGKRKQPDLQQQSVRRTTRKSIGVEYMRAGTEMGKAVVFWASQHPVTQRCGMVRAGVPPYPKAAITDIRWLRRESRPEQQQDSRRL